MWPHPLLRSSMAGLGQSGRVREGMSWRLAAPLESSSRHGELPVSVVKVVGLLVYPGAVHEWPLPQGLRRTRRLSARPIHQGIF